MKISINHPLDTINFTGVNLAGYATIYFSYNTPIAFYAGGKKVIRENDWNVTTGKHLNWIDSDKSIRIPGRDFEKQLDDLLKKLDS